MSYLRRFRKKRWLAFGFLITLIGWLIFTNNIYIWPIRNTLWYHAEQRIFDPYVASEQQTTVAGCLRSPDQQPIRDGFIMASEPNGVIHVAETDATGCYTLQAPAGRFVPVAIAPGYELMALKAGIRPPYWSPNNTHQLDGVLPYARTTPVPTVTDLQLSESVTLSVDRPQPAQAVRREISYSSVNQANQLTYIYTPVSPTLTLPTLLAVYPGAADLWEGVSIPLAAAGYTVIAIGPEYSFDIERDVLEIRQLVELARRGSLPHARGDELVLLAGSYSTFHVMRLLEEDTGFAGAVLLGPISDIFEMRASFEDDSFIPPFDLDKALVALGRPHNETMRYARYSPLWHVRPGWPPLLLMHSYQDEVVPAEQSKRLLQELERWQVPVESHFFEGMSHYLRTDGSPEDLQRLYDITLRFLEQVTDRTTELSPGM